MTSTVSVTPTKSTIVDSRSPLFVRNPIYKPFTYPWAYEAWLTQQQLHWLPDEVPMAEDIKDWNSRLNDPEKNLLTHIFRFFTQMDVEVGGCVALHCAVLRCVVFRCVWVRCIALCCVVVRCAVLRCVAVRCGALRARWSASSSWLPVTTPSRSLTQTWASSPPR